MKKHFFFFLWLAQVSIALSAQAQQKTYLISATIIDSATLKPVGFATTLLKKGNEVIRSTLANEIGNVEIRAGGTGKFSLTAGFTGYRSNTVEIELSESSSGVIHLGEIKIGRESKVLKEVVVVSKKNIINQDVDKITYDVQSDPDSKGQNMLEMVTKIPLLSLDADDNVQLKGNSSFKILINGKASGLTARSPKDALRSIQAANVLKVEVITMPSAKYESEGVGGIINIITKKPAEGYNGLVGLFHNNLYAAGAWVNLGIKKGKFGMFGYVDRYITNNPGFSFENSRTSILPQPFKQVQRGSSDRTGNIFFSNTEFTYEIDSLNLLTASVGYNMEDSRQTGEQSFRFFNNDGIEEAGYKLDNINTNNFSGLDWGANYQMGFRKNSDRLVTVSYKYIRSVFDGTIDNRFVGGNLGNLYQRNESGTREQTIQLDYYHPFRKLTIEGGIKYITRDNHSDLEAVEESQGNDFKYLQNVFGFYNSYQLKLTNWGIKAGVRLERTSVDADFIAGDDFQTSYTNLIPSLSFQRKFSTSSITWGYTQRIERPGIGQLNPFINKNNPLNYNYGNPSLKPALSHSFELSYNRNKKANTLLSLSYAFANNIIQSVVFIRPDSISVTTYNNIGKYDNFGLNLNYKYPITKQFNISINGNIKFLSFEGTADGKSFKHDGFQGFIGSNYSYYFKKDWKAGSSLNVASPFIKVQGETSGYLSHSFNISKELFNKKATLAVNSKNPFLKYRNVITDVNTPLFTQRNNNQNYTRGFLIYYIHRFGKLKESIKKSKRGVSNDDVKKESSSDGD
ncbi:outer membrane beta-barrel protein [Desertivirga xinjiangensis]|uniref:outer membrane beta-barrel protein n=1 Tax=Desertivirga xinjiangensis TaxID=539206 RepID=UPI00210C32AE|nr:outer membrane beta-barrel protein [Pedobacter xinjiangensis]